MAYCLHPNVLAIVFIFTQIWTALIAILLIKFMRFKATSAWSLSNLVAFLRWNLFTYRNLWDWLDRPDDTPPLEPPPSQQPLPFRVLDSKCYHKRQPRHAKTKIRLLSR